MSAMLSSASRWEIGVQEIMQLGERRLNMMRAFNAREDFTRAEDVLPKQLSQPLGGEGPTAWVVYLPADLEHYKDVYYGKLERDLTRPLIEGDEVRVFRQGAGG